jgi:hypothetical protein
MLKILAVVSIFIQLAILPISNYIYPDAISDLDPLYIVLVLALYVIIPLAWYILINFLASGIIINTIRIQIRYILISYNIIKKLYEVVLEAMRSRYCFAYDPTFNIITKSIDQESGYEVLKVMKRFFFTNHNTLVNANLTGYVPIKLVIDLLSTRRYARFQRSIEDMPPLNSNEIRVIINGMPETIDLLFWSHSDILNSYDSYNEKVIYAIIAKVLSNWYVKINDAIVKNKE